MASTYDLSSSSTPTQHSQMLSNDGRPNSSQDDISTATPEDNSWQAYRLTPTTTAPATAGNTRTSGVGGNATAVAAPFDANAPSLTGATSQRPRHASHGASTAVQPGGFKSDMKSLSQSRSVTPKPEQTFISRRNSLSNIQSSAALNEIEGGGVGGVLTPGPNGAGNGAGGNPLVIDSEQRQAALREKISKEKKIIRGTENMLEALLAKNPKHTKEQRLKVESELNSAHQKLNVLQRQLEDEIQRAANSSRSPTSSTGRLSVLFRGAPPRSDSKSLAEGTPYYDDMENESPTFVLSETLQALELAGMPPDYYVERANSLVELFKRQPTLKYDLVWSVFGLRVQTMLLSDSREVVAAGYRLTRYAIADRQSLKIIRSLHTDELVTLSLVKETKASMEREQALKFVRAFLDVKDGVKEISLLVARTLVSIAELREDRLRSICVVTLAEMLVKDPELVYSAGGISLLADVLSEGVFGASESLVASFLYILDTPHKRKYLRAGSELECVFAAFTGLLGDSEGRGRMKSGAKVISAMLKSWQGLIILSQNDARPLRSLLDSLQYPDIQARIIILELIFDALRIKPPSWSSSYFAGRRLTTYGRVTNLNMNTNSEAKHSSALYAEQVLQEPCNFDLTAHFSALVLATLVKAGLVESLSLLVEDETDIAIKRKATLLLTEVLKLCHHSLPRSISDSLQALPNLVALSSIYYTRNPDYSKPSSTSTIYQIDSISRTLTRSDGGIRTMSGKLEEELSTSLLSTSEKHRHGLSGLLDEAHLRTAILETNVLSHVNFMKWKWDLIHSLIEGPLTNPKRLDEAIRTSKFMKRLVGFYRPFKRRFSNVKNTKPNQRYIRTGCALMRLLVSSPEGTRYLIENKLLRQIAECLAQVDRMSGLTSAQPLFSKEHMAETLSGGYFAMLGVLSKETNGLLMMERWHMHNMFYHIIELQDRPDLIQCLLGNMNYSPESHMRILLSKALTTGTKDIRIFCTRLLRKYVIHSAQTAANLTTAPMENRNWVIRLLVTQLYDPDVAVCEVAVKILEEACNQADCLEYIVRCRPSLDHLGEIGAPLLLRFLSTSVGYHYLDGLDYINQEMDDWFLGRNDAYVGLVEASLTRAYVDQPRRNSVTAFEDLVDISEVGVVPPHFYRELARTAEGCKLLEDSGHFLEFATTIRDFDLNEEDPEVLLKVKGCLWAVGNVGSMELSAPFLEETDIVPRIVEIAEHAGVMTMRGTAFFVLGLISRSKHGLEMLMEAGWDAAVDQSGRSLGCCLPIDLNRLYPEQAAAQIKRYKAAATDSNHINQKILGLIVDLGNSILAKRAAADLHVVKTRNPEAFRDLSIFRKTLVLLDSHHYRLQTRRFALDIFDKSVMRHLVLSCETNDDSDTGPSDSDEVSSSPEVSDSDVSLFSYLSWSMCSLRTKLLIFRCLTVIRKDRLTSDDDQSIHHRRFANPQTYQLSAMPSVDRLFDSLGSPNSMRHGATSPSRDGVNWHESTSSIVRLIRCSKCFRPFREAVRLPCGRSLCRKCLPPTHRRRYITYPPSTRREEGFTCPFNDVPEAVEMMGQFWAIKPRRCVADHASADCGLDVTLNNIASAFREILGDKTGNDALASLTDQINLGENGALSLISAYQLMEKGFLPDHAQLASKAEQDAEESALTLAEDDTYQRLKTSVRAELNCQLCFALLMDPITTPCGHTFCRSCLSRAVDHSDLCPFCRKELLVAFTVQSEPGNLCLSTILHTMFHEELRERVEAFNLEGVGYTEYGTLPLFITTLGFPTMRTFLHVFEARYQALIRYAMDAGDRRFGLVMRNRARAAYGSHALHFQKSYGTVMLIERCEELVDGRILVRAKGTSRFRILNVSTTSAGYFIGQIQRVEDISITDEETLEYAEVSRHYSTPLGGPSTDKYDRMSTAQLLDIVKEYVRDCRERGLPWLSQRTLDAYGQPPTSAATYPYWLATVLPIRSEEKYALLKTKSVRQRLKITAGWVRDTTSISLYVGPFAFSFTVGGSSLTLPQYGSASFDKRRSEPSHNQEMGFASRTPTTSLSWLRKLYGIAVTETESATYISKKMVFTIIAAVLLGRAIRRLIDVARRKRLEQLSYRATLELRTPNALDNIANWTMREGGRTGRFEVTRTAEVLIESEPAAAEEDNQPTQSNRTTNDAPSG
ncbi:hypothetical protein KEM54_005403 [Ascosphaera aggregata]|nr:hypothetical protein KEM54_005403 [Ascosphaera aggregata]